MSMELEAELAGSQDNAKNAVVKIQQKINSCKEARLKLKYATDVLRGLCIVISKCNGKHYGLYSHTLVHVLAPQVQSTANAKLWACYLDHVRYFYFLLTDRKLYNESNQVFAYISDCKDLLQNEGDYKFVLSLYLHQLLSQRSHQRIDAKAAEHCIEQSLEALVVLFQDMRRGNTELNFLYPELIAEFVQYLVPKRASIAYTYLSSLPPQKSRMYDALFELLRNLRTPAPLPAELSVHCQRHLEAQAVFLQLDVVDRLQEQVALRHLHACRDMRLLQSDKNTGYVFSLLYYLLKLYYGVPSVAQSFQNVYADIVKKLTNYFDKMGEVLMQQRWFTDVPVLLAVLLTHMQLHVGNVFDVAFWKQMNSVECYISHLELIMSCIKLAPRIGETKLLVLSCCTSARKHTILTLMQAALGACIGWLQYVDMEKADKDLLATFNAAIMQIVRHGISVIDTLICLNTKESTDLHMLLVLYGQLTRFVRTASQADFILTLAPQLLRIRDKFLLTDWTWLLRRLYKTASMGTNPQLTIDLQIAYISAIVRESACPDVASVYSQIGIFYASSYAPNEKCILKLYEESKSAFKLPLNIQQKRMLYWWDVQHFCKYQRANGERQLSLLEHGLSAYDKVLIASMGKQQSRVTTWVEEIAKDLRLKRVKTGDGLTRLELLILAHACTVLLHEQLSVQKKSVVIEIKCQEDNLEELLQHKELSALNVQNEIKLVQLGEEALEAFGKFHEKASIELISSDEAILDWERITEDLSSLALYFQIAGYIENAAKAWLLHYRICDGIEDFHSALRSLSYFCEHCDYFEQHSKQLNLPLELETKQPNLIHSLERLPLLSKRIQNYILISVCHLAYYQARQGNFSYAQLLLQLVQLKHSELPEQQGSYNVVLGTVDVVKFRILWKLLGASSNKTEKQTVLAQKCLLREVEQTLECFRMEVFKVTSSEVMTYTILLLNLIQEVAECATNRLCDYFVNSYFAGTFNLLLQSRSALRLIQLLSMWALVNLQMEFVKKAQVKIKLIECIMGVKSMAELRQLSEKTATVKKPTFTPLPTFDALQPGMEIMRKVAQVPMTPVKLDRTQLSPSTRRDSLKRYLESDKHAALQEYEVLQWNYFFTGCLNARSHFLAENYEQLEDFYDQCQQWLTQRKDKYLQISFQNMQLLNMQHYVNYLRQSKKFDKALVCLGQALKNCSQMEGNVDCAYRVNFMLQLRATQIEMLQLREEQVNTKKLRRALAFNVSPEKTRPHSDNDLADVGALLCGGGGTAKKTKPPAFSIFDGEAEQRRHKYKSLAVDVGKGGERVWKAGVTSSSELSSPDSEMESVLNSCQAVQSIDLADSDDQQKSSRVKSVKKSQKPAGVKTPRILALKEKRLKSAQSISLTESDDSDSVRSVTDTVKKKPIRLLTNEQKAGINKTKSTPKPKSKEISIIELDDSIASGSTDDINIPKNKTINEANTPHDAKSASVTPKTPSPVKKSKTSSSRSTKSKTTTTKQSRRLNVETPPTTTAEDKTRSNSERKLEFEITKKTTTTATKIRTKTEIRTLKFITKETAVRLIAPNEASNKQQSERQKDKTKEPDVGDNAAKATTRTRTRARKAATVVNDENLLPSGALVAVNGGALSRRRRP